MPATTENTTAALDVRDIKILFSSVDAPTVLAVEHLSLSVQSGEFVALIGPSGCGKTSTLNAMAGLVPVDAGEICLFGERVTGVSPRVGYISQADNLLPWRTVLDNVTLGLSLRGTPRREGQEKARELLSRMGLSDFERNYPHELSGGMKKRVAIARVLAIEPDVLFMDEPFSSLDAFTRGQLQDDILTLWTQSGQTVVYVTHDLTEAICLADRVVLIGGRPGRLCGEYTIPLKRPRRVMDVRFDDEFLQLERSIWEALRNTLSPQSGDAYG